MKRHILVFLLGAVMSGAAYSQTTYTATVITFPSARVSAHGLNASGQVAGTLLFSDNVNTSHAFLTGPNGAQVTDLGTLGGTYSWGWGVNDSGQVVGQATATPGYEQTLYAFITGANGTNMTSLGVLGGNYTQSGAYAINARGQVVGKSTASNGSMHAFVTGANGSSMIDLGTLGGLNSLALAINPSGRVAGYATTAGLNAELDGNPYAVASIAPANVGFAAVANVSTSMALGINDANEIVGFANFSYAADHDHAICISAQGTLSDVGAQISGASESRAVAINRSGQVAIWALLSDGFHVFVTGAHCAGLTDVTQYLPAPSLSAVGYFPVAINDNGQILVNDGNPGVSVLGTNSLFPDIWSLYRAILMTPQNSGGSGGGGSGGGGSTGGGTPGAAPTTGGGGGGALGWEWLALFAIWGWARHARRTKP